MIVGSTIFIVAVFPVVFRYNLLSPLQKVVEGIKKVNAGDLQVNVSVKVQDEIGYLAGSFNQMIESLRNYTFEMENLVSQRTAELQQQKEELLTTLEQLKTAQTKLKQLDVQKTRFFDNITHEFRTPLTLILAPVQHLLANHEKNSPPYPYLQSIERNAGQLLGLINQLLDLSRLESNALPLKNSRGHIIQFTLGLIEGFRPAIEQKGIRLTCESDITVGEHLFDTDKWEKIVSNLLANALKFTPPAGTIKITCQILHSNVLILKVADTGIGIPTEKLPYIFDRFYQADDSRTRAFEGSGIGLALVKELTLLLGGTVEVESTEGKGTTFTIQLPLPWATGGEQILPATIEPKANLSMLEIPVPEDNKETKPLLLLVEDHQEMLHFLCQELAATYRVLTATNGAEGLALARKELPEVVISDVMMPEMDGYALCEALKTDPQTDHIALLLLTARSSQSSRLEGLSLGADDFITKPFHLEELGLRIRNLLDRQEKLREFYFKQWNIPGDSASLPLVRDTLIEKLYMLIEANLDDPALDPEKLASEVAMSVRTLNRKLNTLMGISAAKLIRIYRLKKAAEFLKNGYTVSDTAYQVGFESPSYFATAFKEYYQKTPSEYIVSGTVVNK